MQISEKAGGGNPQRRGDLSFIAMEFLDGTTLKHLISGRTVELNPSVIWDVNVGSKP